MKTLVCLVSRQVMANLIPILTLDCQKVELLYTEEEKRAHNNLKQAIKGAGKYIKIKEHLVDAYDFEGIQEFCSYIISDHPDIILNATGGTKVMAFAAYSAFTEAKKPIFYLDSFNNKGIYFNPFKVDEHPVKIPLEIMLADYDYLDGLWLEELVYWLILNKGWHDLKVGVELTYTGTKIENEPLNEVDVMGIKNGKLYLYGKNIAIDITGGKKSMVGGAAIAGALTGCDIFYVDFHAYDEEKRQPVPGTEYLNFLSNPFEVFGDLEIDKGKRLFNEGNYHAASQIFQDLLEKLPRNDEAVFLHDLSLMFRDWDEYNFQTALESCKKAIKQARRCQIYLHFLESLEEKEILLQKLIEGEQLTFILNHYFTSQRMAKRNRFDFAALLLYRTLEMAFAIF